MKTYSKPLATVALALALSSAPALATAAGASPDDGPVRHRSADTLVATGADDRHGRVLAELSPDGRRLDGHGLGLGALPGGLAGGGGTAGHGASGSLSAGPWCIYQCITSGVAYEHGDGVELVVETSVPADIVLLICRDDDGDSYCDYHAWNSSGAGATEFNWVIDPLPAGTYWVTATATDTTGTSHAFGTFTLA